MSAARPFLKWPGGKTQLLPRLRDHYPGGGSFDRYHEPFLGGGAVYFDLRARGLLDGKSCYLSDTSAELCCAYRVVRDHCDELCDRLLDHAFAHQGDAVTHYYSVRSKVTEGEVESAARTIYLNKTCFNGLHRVNKKGEFNVSLGDYKNPLICDANNLRACSLALSGAEVVCADFGEVWGRGMSGRDFVYFDPPYLPASRTAYFTSYTREKFRLADHSALAGLFRRLDGADCLLLLTSAASAEADLLYKGFSTLHVESRRAISCKGAGRGSVGELVVSNRRLDREVARERG